MIFFQPVEIFFFLFRYPFFSFIFRYNCFFITIYCFCLSPAYTLLPFLLAVFSLSLRFYFSSRRRLLFFFFFVLCFNFERRKQNRFLFLSISSKSSRGSRLAYRVCACVHVCARVSVCACVCVCVRALRFDLLSFFGF